MIQACPKCRPHPFQDQKYGNGNRVFNERAKTKESNTRRYRCTVCTTEVEKVTGSAKKAAKAAEKNTPSKVTPTPPPTKRKENRDTKRR